MYFELNRHPAQVPRTKTDFCPPPQYWAGELCSVVLANFNNTRPSLILNNLTEFTGLD